MHRKIIATGAILAALAVALGAFGAHGLQRITQDEKILQGYQTAVQYQLWHSLAILLTGILFTGGFTPSLLKNVALCFFTGILLFSGSLYLLTFLKIQNSSFTSIIGPVTPLGGLLLIAGWLMLAYTVWKK